MSDTNEIESIDIPIKLVEVGHDIITNLLRKGDIGIRKHKIKCDYYVDDNLVKTYFQDFEISVPSSNTNNNAKYCNYIGYGVVGITTITTITISVLYAVYGC